MIVTHRQGHLNACVHAHVHVYVYAHARDHDHDCYHANGLYLIHSRANFTREYAPYYYRLSFSDDLREVDGFLLEYVSNFN